MTRSKLIISFLIIILCLSTILNSTLAAELYPLYPKVMRKGDFSGESVNSLYSPQDMFYPLAHHDGEPEYYLASGVLNDTFFVVFEPVCVCSVHYAEIEWWDSGNINAFAAWYSEEAQNLYPHGQAPPRGQSPVSPVGSFITDIVPNSTVWYGWKTLDLGGREWLAGNPHTLESRMFGVGFIKQNILPHPRADKMDSKGIRYTYTWFGGPWVLALGYDNPWGAYNSSFPEIVIDLMMTVWVSYPWGMPIIISDVNQLCDTYSFTGPFTITCHLEDDPPGITVEDSILLQYRVNEGDTISLPMIESIPGSGIFQADIYGDFAVGDTIIYWIYAMDDTGLESYNIPLFFEIIEPDNEDAHLLLVDEGLVPDIGVGERLEAYTEVLDNNGIEYEIWEVYEHNGIDESVINWGWGSILIAGWGVSTLPALEEFNPYSGFLDEGGNLCLIDQDYFAANGLTDTGAFIPGDFAYDYFGLAEYWNNPGQADASYMGEAGDPITGIFDDDPYETYWDESGIHMSPDDFSADYFSVGSAEEIFYGVNDWNAYGVKYHNETFKTVFLSFMAEASCEFQEDSTVVSDDFRALITNILAWLEVPMSSLEGCPISFPAEYILFPNYPNPFNLSTTIPFAFPTESKVKIEIYNLLGQRVAVLLDCQLTAGIYQLNWDASDYTSGIYFYQLKTGFGMKTGRMLLVK